MACSDYQTECLRVVTIGYLKGFIGSDVQNSTNGSPMSISDSYLNTYCPTYSELTGGTIIQTWSQGSTPRSDRDGITVNQTWAGGSSGYAANQLVDQRDLGLKYTRFNNLSISRTDNGGNISECGGSATLTYTYNHSRYTKGMNNSCVTSTSSSNVNSPCGEITYHATYGSVSNCTSYSIGKNGSFSAASRTDNVYASTTFRGATKTSNSINIYQKPLTGSYSKEKSRWETTTGVTATATSQTSFDCNGGTYSARGTRHYNVVGRYAWVDSCNVEYSQTQDRNISTNQSQDLGVSSGTFKSYDCCVTSHTETQRITFSRDGYSSPTFTFTQTCSDCSSSDACKPKCDGVVYTLHPDKQVNCNGGSVTFTFEGGCKCSLLSIGTTSMSFAESGETKTANFTLAAACGLDWTKPSWITVSESRNDDGTGTLSCVASANDTGSQRTGTIKLKVNGSECHSISVSQDGAAPVDCDKYGFWDMGTIEGASGNEGAGVAWSEFSAGQLTFSASESAYWIVFNEANNDGSKYYYICHALDNPGGYREGNAVFTSSDGCKFTATVKQRGVPTPTCTVTFNIGGSYRYIDTVVLMNPSSGGGTYILNGSGSSKTAEIACGITFTGIIFNDTVQQHCAYFTNSTGGTITDGATFSATITGNTCGN